MQREARVLGLSDEFEGDDNVIKAKSVGLLSLSCISTYSEKLLCMPSSQIIPCMGTINPYVSTTGGTQRIITRVQNIMLQLKKKCR